MPEPGATALIYQLRVVVRGISPLIWRRLLVPADTTIAGLHQVGCFCSMAKAVCKTR